MPDSPTDTTYYGNILLGLLMLFADTPIRRIFGTPTTHLVWMPLLTDYLAFSQQGKKSSPYDCGPSASSSETHLIQGAPFRPLTILHLDGMVRRM
jgi:hypothetical protein